MASNEQWVFTRNGETFGPFPNRRKAVQMALKALHTNDQADIEDRVVEWLAEDEVVVSRLNSPA